MNFTKLIIINPVTDKPNGNSRKVFNDHFIPAHVDFGIAFSIKFLYCSAFLGFQKDLEQDNMSSLVSGRKVQNMFEI